MNNYSKLLEGLLVPLSSNCSILMLTLAAGALTKGSATCKLTYTSNYSKLLEGLPEGVLFLSLPSVTCNLLNENKLVTILSY